MDDSVRRTELAKFLRYKRGAITPEACGLPKGDRRRTPGLRREEVALLANVGVAWYTWLEQGRDIHVSREAVNRIATALTLSRSDREYLASLAAQQTAIPENLSDDPVLEAQAVLDGFHAGPAMLWNSRFDCVAYNRLADVIYDWSDAPEPFGRNVIWRFFMDAKRRDLYSDAGYLVLDCVGMLRARYASQVGQPVFESLVKVLLAESEAFGAVWAQQRTALIEPVPFVLTHPVHGRLAIRSVRAVFPPISESTLVFGIPIDASTKAVFKGLSSG